MSNLHPIFEQALAPFIRRQRVTNFDYTLNGVELECEIHYEPPERETPDCPGEPAVSELRSAYCGEQDIYELLSDKQIEEIEIAFLNQPEESL